MPARRWTIALVAPGLLLAGLVAPAAEAQPAVPAVGGLAVVAAADPGTESQFVSAINSLRTSKGLNALSVSGELVGVARRWTDQMVAAGQISHNPSLGSQVSGSWTKLGENVGVGYDVGGLMQAFINSPSHYKNLVDPAWTHVGVGVSFAGDGRIYTTHNFMAIGGGAPPPAPPSAPPATAPGPAPTTTTTAPPPPPPAPAPAPKPTRERVTAVLDPLRSLEAA